MKNIIKWITWLGIGLFGVGAYVTLALHRGEQINSAYILIAAFCSYAIGYRFYSKWIAARVLMINDRRATPCEVHDDGRDFVKTNKWIVFGHHFAAISGPGPLVGPVLAAQFGYLPGILWILIGVVLGGAVQDFVILFCSLRRNGKSLAQMVRDELNSTAGVVAILAILAIMTILLAVLALVVVKALAESPWGVFTVGATIPIAMLMGGYLRFWRIGKVLEATAIGVILLLLAVWGGKFIYADTVWAGRFTLGAEPLAWSIIIYGLAASVLPVWLLLAPRDYLSTFMKLGTIFALAIGIFFVLPDLKMPALSQFIDGTGPVVAGKLFPFCFITIACGAISGFHSLISSGTTPKLVTRENYSRFIGYGAMIFESLVATMALIAACTLEPGIYLSMNIKGAAADTVAQVTSFGFPVTVAEMDQLAETIGEKTLFGRTGGAATLAVGMAKIFSEFVSGHGLDLWYHFAIMFEALFILTTLDAGTRVGRYLLQDALGHVWKPLGETRHFSSNIVASLLMVSAWGYFLIQGVRDPLGGINSLWPLFGIANQLLAGIALCLGTTIILKMQLAPRAETESQIKPPRPAFALITLVPLAWLLAVTMTAGAEKIFSSDPRVGFLAEARGLDQSLPSLESASTKALLEVGSMHPKIYAAPVDQRAELEALLAEKTAAYDAAQKAVQVNRTLWFNQILDAIVAAIFLVLVVAIVGLSGREWYLLLARRRQAILRETAPVWLPDYALAAEKPVRWFNLFALVFALARELSGEAEMERAQHAMAMQTNAQALLGNTNESHSQPVLHSRSCQCGLSARHTTQAEIYMEVAQRRFKGINRCC